ncbi:cytochrome c biogenesis protein ResB [Gordonia paraffinivorans]|uniref:ResB-like family n=1 Tax=Gordonia paraffinivorans TaxID=175628 RepID=A0ABD7V638_9ACTN|nr:cytochrome c biogenesis protein ResB [Gordonia paraffinivorans]MCD2145529.1 cytochrome c biogenesis protein ResB [Gordonia paraffinivorans]VFA89809.1 ResB-like family [Gordonia paraffinivorans]
MADVTDTDVADRPRSEAESPSPRKAHWARRRILWPLRNLWRSLTSMRTALLLLFLLALAAIPGALLPQRDLNEQKTLEYIAARGKLGTLMDRLQLFDVFSSAWFTAIYVLLFVSLVGCLTPRMVEHFKSLRARPVAAPRNLSRLPRHITRTVDGTPEEIAERIDSRLRGWRSEVVAREPSKAYPDGCVEVSAEKGYLREFGNLVFHFALLALLVSIAVGKLYGYEGTRSLVADGEQGMCNTSTAVYDSFRAGNLVDGTDLSKFCFRVDDFSATFLPSGQPDMYDATISYAEGDAVRDPAAWTTTSVKVNEPLRVAGDRVYVLGNGFAPTFTVTFPNGEKRTQTTPFVPDELQTMLSSGAMRFDTPAGLYPDADERRKNQIALEGLFAPDALYHGTLLTSASPEPRDPAVAIRIFKGDTGLDTGKPQNAYSLDQDLIEQGRLQRQAQVNLAVGQSHTLADGTTVTFDGYQRWVSVQVSHDPAQIWVLVSAVVMLGGLLVSLLVRRRRIWARLVPAPAGESAGQAGGPDSAEEKRRTVVEIAGLARTDQAGWGEGFDEQAAALVADDADPSSSRRTTRRL